MSIYIKIEEEKFEKVEEMLNVQNISFDSTSDPTYFCVMERIETLIENNMFINNKEDLEDLIEFVYGDFNPLPLDQEILDKMLIYSSKED